MTTFTAQNDANSAKDNEIVVGLGTYNRGANDTLNTDVDGKGLIEFDCSSIPATATCDDATMYLYHSNTGTAQAFILTAYSIATGNAAWIAGTTNSFTAAAGESCWNALAADGAGGVTTAWAGSAGLSTVTTDYETPELGHVHCDRGDAAGTEYAIALTAARVQGWFGASNTNYGMLITNTAWGAVSVASYNHATAGYRPKLVVNYTLASTGLKAVRTLLGVGK